MLYFVKKYKHFKNDFVLNLRQCERQCMSIGHTICMDQEPCSKIVQL